jgi:hypothetical protein
MGCNSSVEDAIILHAIREIESCSHDLDHHVKEVTNTSKTGKYYNLLKMIGPSFFIRHTQPLVEKGARLVLKYDRKDDMHLMHSMRRLKELLNKIKYIRIIFDNLL